MADTKFEFGTVDGELILIDECLTPDSSRFWPADSYVAGQSPPSFDKQFVRDYLETLDWDKTPPAPSLPAEVIEKTSAKYREAFVRLTGTELATSSLAYLRQQLSDELLFPSFNSATEASIFARLNSLTGTPWTISQFLPFVRMGKEQISLPRLRSCHRNKRRRCANRPPALASLGNEPCR